MSFLDICNLTVSLTTPSGAGMEVDGLRNVRDTTMKRS